ncbi:DNA-directed DNA polymerase [Tanacetum coccineum]
MTETMEQYMSKTRGNYRSGVVRPKINDKTHFELKGQFLKELRENTFSVSEHEDANEQIKKVPEIVDLFHIPEEVILFYNGLDVPTRQILDSKGAIPTKTVADAKVAIQKNGRILSEMHNRTSSKARSTETSYGLAAIQAQLNNIGREIKKVNEKVYAAQSGAPYQPGGQYRAAGPGFYQRNNGNSSYPDRRQTLEESLTKFIAESTKRHEENSNIIKEIRASTDAAIRNQGSSIKILEIQIGQMRKVLQERGIRGLPGSKEPNPKDHVKSISTAKADSSVICRIRSGLYAISDAQYTSLSSKTIPFPNPLVGLGASVSVMPFSTYSNLGLGNLAHTRLTIELADRTIKHPRGIAKNLLVRIGKFIFPIDFVILDILEDDDVLLILGRPFLSTAHAKKDVLKKITLRVGEEKLVFKSVKPATSIIRRVYMVKERMDLDSKTKFAGEAINESFDPLYDNYIELNDLDMPLEPRVNKDDFEPTLDFINKPTYKSCYKMKFSCMIGYRHVNADFLPFLSINIMTKHFYNSIIKDKGDHEGKNPAGTLNDIPIFVGNFSIISGFSITDDVDITSSVVLGMPFCKKFVSCQKIMERTRLFLIV